MAASAGPPLPDHQQQRLVEADADRGRHRAVDDQGQGAGRACVARPGLGRRRQAALLGRRGREHRPRLRLRRRRPEAGHAAGGRAAGRCGLPPGTTDMAGTGFVGGIAIERATAGRSTPSTSSAAPSARIDLGDRRRAQDRPRCRPSRTPSCRPRRPPRLRLAVGRRQGAGARRGDAGRHRRGRGRRAPERDGAVEGRPAPVRRLRQHQQGVGDRHRDGCIAREQIGVSPFPERAARDDARTRSRCRRTATRSPSPTPTTTPSP